MKTDDYFDGLWSLDWGVGIFFNPPKIFESFFLASGDIDHEYFNFWSPRVLEPSKLDLRLIDIEFKKIGRHPAVYLTQNQQQAGFLEYLVCRGYRFEDSECWLGYDKNSPTPKTTYQSIAEVNSENWTLFSQPALENFESFETQPEYVQHCYETVSGKRSHPSVTAKFYSIVESDKPVASAGLFFSSRDNFAYLHCGSTNKDYRNKGYQTALIVKRINIALENGISRIYTITERGGRSWTNFVKLGFVEIQNLVLLKKQP